MSTLSMSMFASRAEFDAAKQAQDAQRYRFLAERFLAADFDWGGDGTQVIVFEMPKGFSVIADCDETVDDAMKLAASSDTKTADLFAEGAKP
jgi:hypothetical protein